MRMQWIIVTAGTGLLVWLGHKKYNEIKAIQQIEIRAAQYPFAIDGIKNGSVYCFLVLQFVNPSYFPVVAKQFTSDVFYDGDFLGKVWPRDILLKGKHVTTLNIPLQIELSKFTRLTGDVLSKSKVEINFKGSLKYVSQTLGISLPIPFEYTLDIKKELTTLATDFLN